MAKTTTSEPVYVGIVDAPDIHRTLLHASKDTIYLLKEYDKIVDIRKKKSELYVKFDATVDDIKKKLVQIKSNLPTNVIKQDKPAPAPKGVKQPAVKAPHLDGLDRELAAIEEKLRQLGK